MKRVLDIFIASTTFVVATPLILLISILIIIDIGFPVIFKQKRIGLEGRSFFILKFRTMKHLSKGDKNDFSRMTVLTSCLRNYSLDELPTLLNVIRGDMSIVGPRPLLEEYRFEYTPTQFKRHNVRPGITGWAQINGRNSLSWEQKFNLDLWYVYNHTIILDLRIILLTFYKIIKKEGINYAQETTMEAFKRKK